MNIKGKTIIVTGSSEGIGKEIALALAKQGANLALVARNEANLKQVLSQIIALGSKDTKLYVCDLSNLAQIKATTAQIIADYPKNLIGLVNNAGVWQKLNNLEDIPDDELTEVIQINLTGLIRFTKEMLPTFKQQLESAIINISSRSGLSAHVGQTVYAATKWGVRGFTGVLIEDLKDTNIHIAGVYQGKTNTDIFNKVGEGFTPEQQSSFIPARALGEVIASMFTLPPQIWLSEIHVENK